VVVAETRTRSRRVISDEILDRIRLLRRTGRVIFASARPIRDLLPVLPPNLHALPLAGGNGAFVRLGGDVTVSGFDPDTRERLDDPIAEHTLPYLVDGESDYSYTGSETHRIYRQLDAGRARAADALPRHRRLCQGRSVHPRTWP
jgi:hydroxymethylpyrimidine pyrophosphatase-like HAD family hydrolase